MNINRIRNKLFRVIQCFGLDVPCYKEKELTSLFKEYMGNTSSLDLGSGPFPKNPFNAKQLTGVDIRSYEKNNVVYGNIASSALPFDTNSFDYVTAFDVLEHIPRVRVLDDGEQTFPLIMLMNEVFRVLKPEGVFFNIQPCFPMKEVFQDPTHVNIMSEDTINLYFCESAWARIYGFEGSFSMKQQGWLGSKYFSFIRKSHNEPIRDLGFLQK